MTKAAPAANCSVMTKPKKKIEKTHVKMIAREHAKPKRNL